MRERDDRILKHRPDRVALYQLDFQGETTTKPPPSPQPRPQRKKQGHPEGKPFVPPSKETPADPQRGQPPVGPDCFPGTCQNVPFDGIRGPQDF